MQSHVLSAWEPFQTIWLKIVWIYGSSVSWQIEAENGPCSLGPSLYFGIRPFSRRGEIAAREGHLGTCLISAQSVFNESKIVRFCRLSRGAKMERTRFLVRKQTLRPETSAHSWQSRVRDALFSTLFLNGRTIKKLTASFPARGAGGGGTPPTRGTSLFRECWNNRGGYFGRDQHLFWMGVNPKSRKISLRDCSTVPFFLRNPGI